MKKYVLFLIFIILIISFTGIADEKSNRETIILGETIILKSKALGEDRPIHLFLPTNYDKTNNRYPVLYQLDGELNHFLAVAGLVKYLEWTEIPQMLVVAIPSIDQNTRQRDMGLVHHDQLAEPKAENFLKFIVEELVPYIDKEYRTSAFNIISGGSAAGCFSTWAMIKHPDVFKVALASSPAYGDSQEIIEKDTLDAIRNNRLSGNIIYIDYFDQDFTICTLSSIRYINLLSNLNPNQLDYIVKVNKGAKHVASDYQLIGLTEIFKDWEPPKNPMISPSSGELNGQDSIEVEISSEENSVRYTLDGTEPSKDSILYTKPIIINKPVTIKTKAFRSNISQSRVSSAEYKTGKVRTALSTDVKIRPGLVYKYFEKNWIKLPDKFELNPDKNGVISKISTDPRRRNDAFMFEFDGYLKVPVNGTYTLYLKSSSKSKLFLSDENILYNDTFNREKETSNRIHLEEGLYKIMILYANGWFQGTGLKLSWEGPGFKKSEIEPDYYFHDDE